MGNQFGSRPILVKYSIQPYYSIVDVAGIGYFPEDKRHANMEKKMIKR